MEHVELVDRVYLKIKQMIFDQQLKPGQKLIQEKLSSELGVSRSPLLKALEKLEGELLVEKIPRRGMYVKEMTLNEIIDVFQCRAVIEGLSARLTAGNITDAEADRTFHTRIMQWSNNKAILRLEVLSNIHLKAYQTGLLRPPEDTLTEHLEIIEAIAAKNGTLAEKLMRAHIEKSIATLHQADS